MRGTIVLTIVGWLACQPMYAGDWTQWRGPQADGIAEGESLVDAIPPGGLPVLWVRELGPGYSSFAIVGDRAYTMTQSLYEQSVVCLNLKSGKTIWSHACGWPYDGGGLYPGPRSTPTVVGGRVYFATPQGLVGCVEAQSGSRVWAVNVNERFGGRGTEFGYSASPLVVDELVILPVGGFSASVVALSADDGSLVWKAGTKPASYASPLAIEWRGEPLVVALLQNSLACIHRRTGELWWDSPMSHGYDEHSASPIYREPDLFVSGPFQSGGEQFRLESRLTVPSGATDIADPARCQPMPQWFCRQMSNDVASSVLVGDTLYGFDLREAQSRLHRPSRGEFRAIDWETGTVRWSSREPGHAQVIAADGKLILWSDRGELLLARQSAERYEELGRMPLFSDEVCWTPPVLSRGYLLVRTQTRAACVYLGREPLDWQIAEQVVPASSLARSQRFDPGVLLGGEREYPATLPAGSEFRRWYLASMAAIGIGWLLAWGAQRLKQRWSRPILWGIVLAAGVFGGPVWHVVGGGYLFLWPLVLWTMFQWTVSQSWRIGYVAANQPASDSANSATETESVHSRFRRLLAGPRIRSYLVGGMFLAVCALYFHLCRWLGLAIEWGFLTGFAVALPAAILAAGLAIRQGPRISPARGLALGASFSLYYWASVTFLVWRLGSTGNV
jgi:hypothetical protein